MAARLALHAGLWGLAFSLAAAVLGRPLLAVALVACGQALVLAVSAAKARYLREPLVYADLALFSQALRFPRLYLPYFGLARAAGLAVLCLLFLGSGLWLEPPFAAPRALWLLGLIPAALLLALGSALARPRLTAADSGRFGVAAAMWLHALAERAPLPALSTPYARIRWSEKGGTPHIVAVQSESFFDARRLHAQVPGDVLREYDRLAREGESGRLAVPVWGAYTMRTEFAFLSGVVESALGVHRFNPYRRLARAGVDTLASALRARGYRTLCLHPYPGQFFGRDRVLPRLGFDEFIDLAGFADAARSGPYVADLAVSERIRAALAAARQPLFIFAITMENHGPLHLEGRDELAVYLRHLRNADAMLGELAAELGRIGSGVLCFYGDHVPGMPAVYRRHGYEDARTDYLLWNVAERSAARADLAAERLGLRLLERAGLTAAAA
jgi:hypothetical protein